ncbi:MAG: hypothetical protein ACSHYB_12945 [Roseibacillus sp.]
MVSVLFRTWTARIVLAALTIEVGLVCNLFTEEVPFLRRSEEGIFQSFLSSIREMDSKNVILETNPEGDGWSLRTLESRQVASEWDLVEVPLASELFDGKAPKPSEYAILLAKLHQSGARRLAFTHPLTWDDAAELELRALDSSLRPFQEVLLPLDLSEVPEPVRAPSWLVGSRITKAQVVGDASSLPMMNQVTVPPSVSGRDGVAFAFPDFGGRDLQYRAPSRLPILTRWEDGFLPSWPLALAMRLEGVSLSELVIKSGQHVRIGAEGPVVPLDDFGRAKIETIEGNVEELEMISAKTLFPLGEVDLPELKPGVVLVDATSPQRAEESRRLIGEARRLLQFPRPGPPEVFRRLGFGWEVLLYLQIVLVAFVALYLRPFPQLIALAVLCAGLFLLVLGLLNWRGVWTPILPLVVATIMSWCLVGYLQQIAHPVARKRVSS